MIREGFAAVVIFLGRVLGVAVLLFLIWGLPLLGFGGGGHSGNEYDPTSFHVVETDRDVRPAPEPPARDTSCLIKGNIAFDTGEAIYHVPGQAYYDATVIDERYGERWFCSEDEALAAGWRRSHL